MSTLKGSNAIAFDLFRVDSLSFEDVGWSYFGGSTQTIVASGRNVIGTRIMIELNDFSNDGFGWVCRHCNAGLSREARPARSRLLSEGEAEAKTPRLSNQALAKWADAEQRTLLCPRCGITEPVEKS